MTHPSSTAVAIAIRPAGPDDAPALARLRFQFRAGLDAAQEPEGAFIQRCTEWMREHLSRLDSWRCWVAEDAGTIRGMAWLLTLEKLPNPIAEPERHGYVSSLYVEPALRSGGIGSRLLDQCLRECRARSCDAVFLWPSPRSRSLYLRHGFAVRDDLMELRLSAPPAHGGAA